MSKALQFKNLKQTQQHPFHVLTSSKLPLFMSFLPVQLHLFLLLSFTTSAVHFLFIP